MRDGHQRGRTRRIDRQTRALQIQKITDTRGQNGTRAPGKALRTESLLAGALMVVPARTADENPTLAARERARRVPRVLDPLPTRLQEQALLRVHPLRFLRGDVEEQRIKPVVILQCPQPATIGLARHRRARLVIRTHIPPLAAHRHDAVPPRRDVLPILLYILCPGELSGHPNHCNRCQRLRSNRTARTRPSQAPRHKLPHACTRLFPRRRRYMPPRPLFRNTQRPLRPSHLQRRCP